MTKLGSFVRENERPGRRAATLAFDAVVSPRVASGLLLPRLEQRARTAGASEALLARASSLAVTHGVRSSIATYRLLVAVADGNAAAMTPLLNKFKPDTPDELMWDALSLGGYDVQQVRHDASVDLVAFFQDEIRRGFTADGFSQVFEWLLTNEQVPADSPALRPLLESLIDSAVSLRRKIENEKRLFAAADLQIVASDLIDPVDPTRFFLSGGSLLAASHSGEAGPRFGGIEFSTFREVEDVVADIPSEFVLLSRRGDHLVIEHEATKTPVTVVCVRNADGRSMHGDGRYTRWYSTFDVVVHTLELGTFPGPSDVERYLDERFGQWRNPPFYYDPVLDAPNTTVDRSLGGLLFVYSKMRETFAAGRRHYADEWAIIMRDRFGIEYSNFVPNGVPRKVLATPLTLDEVGGRAVRLVVADFDCVDAEFVRWLSEQRSDGHFVVAGVIGDRLDGDANERLALANSLSQVDHAVLIESAANIDEPVDGIPIASMMKHPTVKIPAAT